MIKSSVSILFDYRSPGIAVFIMKGDVHSIPFFIPPSGHSLVLVLDLI